MSEKYETQSEHRPKIIHIMADGSVRDSVEGYAVPANGYTEVCYRLLAEHTVPAEKPVQ